VVDGLARTFGFAPTANGGTLTWAVLDAPRSAPTGPAEDERPEARTSSRAYPPAEQHPSSTIEEDIR
jgi:hypothetical protein